MREKLSQDLYVLCEWIMNCCLSNIFWLVLNIPTIYFTASLVHARSFQGMLLMILLLFVVVVAITLPSLYGLFLFAKDWKNGEVNLQKKSYYLVESFYSFKKNWLSYLVYSFGLSTWVAYLKLLHANPVVFSILVVVGVLGYLMLVNMYLRSTRGESATLIESFVSVFKNASHSLLIGVSSIVIGFVSIFGAQFILLLASVSLIAWFANSKKVVGKNEIEI